MSPPHTTTYAYDTFGNRVQARVQAASGSGANSSTETRCNHDTLAYDSYGRFVMKEKDCLGRLVRRLSRYNAHGQQHEHDDDAVLKQRGEGHRPGRQLHV